MKNTILTTTTAALLIVFTLISAASAQTPECGGSKKNCPPKSAPPFGNYICNVVRWDVRQKRIVFDYQGYFTLKAGGVYSWLDNGGAGKYVYDAKTYKISWTSGQLSGIGGETEFGLDGDDPEITITFKTDSGETEWQCALETK